MRVSRLVGILGLVAFAGLLATAQPAFAQADQVLSQRRPAVCTAQSLTPYLVYNVSDGHWHCSAAPATETLNVGGDTVAGDAIVQTVLTKEVTGIADATATAVFTVTVPNAQHTAIIDVDVLGILGAGGAIGAGEASRLSKYQIVVTRTAGLATVATVSSAIGGAASNVAGAASVSSVVVTASSMTGGATAAQTFNVMVDITKSGGASSNHVAIATARIFNENNGGITIQ